MMIRIPDNAPDAPPEPEQNVYQSPAYQMAYSFGGPPTGNSDVVFKLERGNPRYRYGRLAPVLPQFRSQPLYTRNTNTVPTNVPLTQTNPATSPFVNTTTGRVRYPLGPKIALGAPDFQ